MRRYWNHAKKLSRYGPPPVYSPPFSSRSFLFFFLMSSIQEKLDTIRAEAENLINYSINFNSPQNVAHVLFDVLKLQVPQDKYSGKKFANTKKGNRSTSEAILKKLESQHKLPSMILGTSPPLSYHSCFFGFFGWFYLRCCRVSTLPKTFIYLGR